MRDFVTATIKPVHTILHIALSTEFTESLYNVVFRIIIFADSQESLSFLLLLSLIRVLSIKT